MDDPSDLQRLLERLLAAASGLHHVTVRKMFGCSALFANDEIFALVWKHGRIGVKLVAPKIYEAIAKMPGASPWQPGAMTMRHWVLLPETMHDRPSELATLVASAHGMALGSAAPAARPNAVRIRNKGHTTSSETPSSKRRSKTGARDDGATFVDPPTTRRTRTLPS